MLAPAFVRLTGHVYNGLCAVSTDASFKTAINTHTNGRTRGTVSERRRRQKSESPAGRINRGYDSLDHRPRQRAAKRC